MKKQVSVKLALDSKSTERLKPLKITITYNRRPQQYAIGANILLTKEEFNNSRCKKYKEAMEHAAPALAAAQKIAKEMQQDFEAHSYNLSPVFKKFKERFRDEYLGRRGRDLTLFSVIASEYIENKLVVEKTRSDYKTSVNWLNRFRPNLPIEALTDEDIVDFEEYMKMEHRRVRGNEIADNTIKKQRRQLNAIYNYAIEKGYYTKRSSPFRPTPQHPNTSVRRLNVALSEERLAMIRDYEPQNEKQELSQDFFMLLWYASGCNIGDLLKLKNSNVKGDIVTYYRSKTKIPTSFILTDVSRKIFTKYGCLNPSKPDDYILPYMSGNSGERNMQYRKDNIRNKINDGLEEICSVLQIPKVTTSTMRHTFATLGLNHGTPIGVLSQSLGHTNINTTQIYVDGITTTNLEKIRTMVEEIAPYDVK